MYKLAPQLAGKAQQAYAALPSDEAGDYYQLKTVILKRYNISEETYRQRFRAVTKRREESFRETMVRLQDLQRKWMKDHKTVEEMSEVIVMEQFLNTLSPEMQVWIRERRLKSTLEAGELADQYTQARGSSRHSSERSQIRRREGTSGGAKTCYTCGQQGHIAKDCQKGGRNPNRPPHRDQRGDRPNLVKCFGCGQMGHIATRCPHNALNNFCREQKGVTPTTGIYKGGVVEGQYVSDILLDTGCSRTMVRHELVPPEKMLDGEAVTIQCAHEDTVLYPLARIDVDLGGCPVKVVAAVSRTLPTSMLLGMDVPELKELLHPKNLEKGMMVMTRYQSKKQDAEEKDRQQKDEAESDVKTTNIVEVQLDDSEVETPFADFEEAIFCEGKTKCRLTRNQKRANRFLYRQREAPGDRDSKPKSTSPQDAMHLTKEELIRLQNDDNSLTEVKKAADGKVTILGNSFFRRDGILYRRWTPKGSDPVEGEIEQLVVPKQRRKTILKLAHEIPLAGQTGQSQIPYNTRPVQRILASACNPPNKKQNSFYHPIWTLPVHEDAIRIEGSSSHVSKDDGQSTKRDGSICRVIFG